MAATEKIVLCKMFTGDYWENENNLGHETINMFLPDNSNGESYIYLPASGDYKLDDHEIKQVILVRSVPNTQRETVQILGKAEVVEELLRDENNTNRISSCTRGSEFVGLVKLFEVFNKTEQELEDNISDENIKAMADKCNFKTATGTKFTSKDYYDLAVKLGLKNEVKTEMTDDELKGRLEKHSICYDLEKIKNVQPDEVGYTGWGSVNKLEEKNYWYAIYKKVYKPTGIIKDREEFCKLIKAKYKKAIELRKVFNSQKDNVRKEKYADISYEDMFKGNDNFGLLNICASLKVKNLWLVPQEKMLYLTTKNSGQYSENNTHKYIYIESAASGEDSQHKKNKLSATSQKVYLPLGVKLQGNATDLWTHLSKLEEEYKKNPNSTDCWLKPAKKLTLETIDKDYLQDSFLTVIKKEYDELTYSNLFAYFFKKSSQFAQYFFGNIQYTQKGDNEKKRLQNVSLSDTLSAETVEISDDDWTKAGGGAVKREEKNIDIVLKDGERVIVIENKIKSSLNGVEIVAEQDVEDKSGSKKGNKTTFKDQLTRYYSYIEEKYHTNTPENHKYFIFAPDYNHIEEEKFGTVNGIHMDAVWNIVRYSDIFKCCKDYNYQNDCHFDPFDKTLFNEFLKALNVHTDSSANNYYRQMQKRLIRLL